MSRRPFMAALIALAIATFGSFGAAAQEPDALHPVVGTWITSTPGGPALSTYHADGTFDSAFPVMAGLPSGLGTQSTQLGVWEPTGDRSVHVTGVVLHSDAEGNFTGSFTYDGFQTVSEDGLTIRADDGGTATFRDADGEVTLELVAGDGVVVGTRMQVGAPGFPTGERTLASPAP